jgi:membrane protein implicated in regulation of membrane protease activity
MLFLIGAVLDRVSLAFIFLSWPWRVAAIVVLGLVEILEILLWLRPRHRRSLTGAEGMVGARGRASPTSTPRGG